MIVGAEEEDFAGTASFRAIIPALEQRQMALPNRGCGRGRGCGERGKRRFEAGFENSASELGYDRRMRLSLRFYGSACDAFSSLFLRNSFDGERLREE